VIADFAAGTDVGLATQDVQKAINAASNLLPQQLPAPPTYDHASRNGAVLRLTLASQELPLVEVATVANDVVAQKLAQVSGVGMVDVCGPTAATRITIDPTALAGTGKTIEDVRAAIMAAAVAVPAGSSVKQSGGVAGFRDLPIVRDTARVEDGQNEPSCIAISTGSIRVVAVTVTPIVGADRLAVRERLESLLPTLQAALPQSIHLDAWPRTRPLAYELLLGDGMSTAARIDRLERALTQLHLATRAIVQFGGPDREPNVADLRIVPPAEHAKDLEEDVAPTLERFHLALRGHHDHIVAYSGADPMALRKHAHALTTSLNAIKALEFVEDLGVETRPHERLEIDRVRAADFGISISEIATALRVLAPGGMWVATTYTQSGQSPVMLAVSGELRSVLSEVKVQSAKDGLVPLSSLVNITATPEPDVIFHEGKVPWVGVRISGPLDALNDVLAKLPVPADIKREVRDPD
jgi:multidrug efflux pump subunit AcrB